MTEDRRAVAPFVIGVVVIALAFVLPPSLRWLALPFVLVVPGAAVVTAVLGKRSNPDGLGMIATWCVVSVVVLCGATFLVAAPGNSFTASRTLAAVIGVTVIATVVWVLRFRGEDAGRLEFDGAALVGLVAALVVGVGAIVAIGHLDDGRAEVAFSAMRFGDTAPERPLVRRPNSTVEVPVVVDNHSFGEHTYRGVVSGEDRRTSSTVAFVVGAGRSHSVDVAALVPASGCRTRIRVDLSTSDLDPATERSNVVTLGSLTRWVAPSAHRPCR